MWVGDVYTTKNDIVSIVPASQKITKYPVIINDIVIYYGSCEYDIAVFKNTKNFKNIMMWCEYFNNMTNRGRYMTHI